MLTFSIPIGDDRVSAIEYTRDGPPRATLVLGHGAGTDQRSAFMVAVASEMALGGVRALTFNFPYKEHGRSFPDPQTRLERAYRAVAEDALSRYPDVPLFIGGKSLGGRIATHVAASGTPVVAGLVLLGYPLHPPGKPQQIRSAHLRGIRVPMLIVQGSRDPFGTPAELEPVVATLSPRPELHVVEGGDHSFKTRGRGAEPYDQVVKGICHRIAEWVGEALETQVGEMKL